MEKLTLSDFADKMSEIMPVISKEFVRKQTSGLYKEITLPQVFIMDFLNRQGPSKMTDIAKFMEVSTAAITGIVDRLVKSGYVLRVFDADDRRIIKIKITPKGLSLIKKCNQDRHKMIIDIFGRISETDRQDYLRILTQIKDILTKPEGK